MKKLLTTAIYALSAFTGVVAFTYPFFLPSLLGEGNTSHAPEAPLLTVVLLIMCLAVLLIEVQGQAVSAKVVAALGILVAITAVLRFIETAFPGPGGFSPIFVPIILAGYVFGARFGFLLGANALLVSALITGYVDPLVPFQMFTVGWVGLTAGWLPHPRSPKLQVALLVVVGILWGFLFGAIMNLYSWPFVVDGRATSWQPGVGWYDGLLRYAAYYAATSFLWDFGRALGNALLMAALALPAIRALTRFRDRFQFEVHP
jgi:energy-coupling factor transport system substrate-specific component